MPDGMRYDVLVDDVEPDQDRDPLIEALKRDIDMTLLERNLKLTPQQRIDQLVEMQRFAAELAAAGRKARERRCSICSAVLASALT